MHMAMTMTALAALWQGSIGEIETGLTNISTQMQSLAVPLAIFGVMMALIAWLVVPILPDWAQGMRGYITRALVIVAVISFVPSAITAIAAFGGS